MVGSLGFDVQGWESLAQFGLIRTDRKRGEQWCKNWTFFLDVINVGSLILTILELFACEVCKFLKK